MTLLHPGDVFPELTVQLTDGRSLVVPEELAGGFGVVLFFRGAWCPYCNAQLRAFQRKSAALADVGAQVVALSADTEQDVAGLIDKHDLAFPVGYGADARHLAERTGAFVNDDPLYVQSTGFVLDPDGRVIVSVYSIGAIGRLVPDDVVGRIRYLRASYARSGIPTPRSGAANTREPKVPFRREMDTGRCRMKAIVVTDQVAGTAGMTLAERPEPDAASNDVVVQVHASGFTPGELTWPGTWADRGGRDRTPSIPGHELAGVVSALGYGTTGLSVGQRVFGLADWTRDGTLAEYVAVEARNLAPLPGDVDFTVGASLPISGLTAWQGLFVHGRVQAGQSVLVHGAAGGVGSMVTQLAREAGAYVIGTGRAADRQTALDFGAQEFVDLDTDTLEDVGGVDLVFDVIGGDIQKRSAGLIRTGGTLVTIAGPPEAQPADGLAVDFVVEADRAQLSEIVQRVRDGRLRTNIGNVSTLDDAAAAFNPTERIKGKTIISVRP